MTMDEGRLVFTATGTSQYVHTIEADSGQQLTTRLIEPNSEAGQQYIFSPEYVATSDPRNFNLVLENRTTGERNTWSPC